MSDKKYPAEMSLQEAAINLLATGYSVRDAARILNVEPSTIRHWWGADPLFKPTIDAVRQQAEPNLFYRDSDRK
ncbi:MAG: helix-turn-helix domain-containing protein [Blastocatellia bacterium]